MSFYNKRQISVISPLVFLWNGEIADKIFIGERGKEGVSIDELSETKRHHVQKPRAKGQKGKRAKGQKGKR